MPLYPFECTRGHRFDLMRAIARRDEQATCATCGHPAQRALAAPRLAVLSSTARIAHQRNERSAHEPTRVTRGPPAAHAPVACGGNHGRPWMLGH